MDIYYTRYKYIYIYIIFLYLAMFNYQIPAACATCRWISGSSSSSESSPLKRVTEPVKHGNSGKWIGENGAIPEKYPRVSQSFLGILDLWHIL